MSITRTISIVALVALLAVTFTPVPSAAQSGDSLYRRLGGYDAITAVVDGFIGRMIADPSLKRFFDPFSNDSKGRIRQHLVDQICAAAGGPCVYTGRTMKVAHAGIGITGADWSGFLTHLEATLDKFKVPAREKSDVIAFMQKFYDLDEAMAVESHAIYAKLIIDDARPLAEAVRTVLDQQGKADLPLDRVVDATVVEEVLRERR